MTRPAADRPRLAGRLTLQYRAAPSGARREWPAELAATLPQQRVIDYGERGTLTVAGANVDLAESDARLLVICGALRGADGRWRTARELLASPAADPQELDLAGLTGSALVVAVDRRRPELSALSTFVALQPLYWFATRDGYAAASEPNLLLPLLPVVELDGRAEAAHMIFRFVAGERTYYRDVRKLIPGYRLRAEAAEVRTEVARRLSAALGGRPRFDRIEPESVAWMDRRMSRITRRWVELADSRGQRVGNLLSGGLDSSLVQAWLGEVLGDRRQRSYGFAVDAPSFDFEIENARDASRLLGTEHLAPRFGEAGYPELLDRAIERIGEPTLYNESWPGHLLLAETVAAEPDGPGVLFTGYGADLLLGDSMTDPIQRWLWLRARPRWMERARAALPRLRGRGRWSTWVDAIETDEDPRTLRHPLAHMLIAAEPELLLPAFGPDLLAACFDEAARPERELLASDDLIERMHVSGILTAGFDPHFAVARLYAAHGIDLVPLYADEEAVAGAFAFRREIRYSRARGPWRGRLKPLQQEQLERRGLGELLGRPKGGTAFNADLWRWLSEGCLRERVDAIERPAWLSAAAMAELRRRPTEMLWNLLTLDTWKRRVLRPAAAAAAGEV